MNFGKLKLIFLEYTKKNEFELTKIFLDFRRVEENF